MGLVRPTAGTGAVLGRHLSIAAALLGDPKLLILDEPANGLDPQGVREMRALVGGLARTGRTVLGSSHD